MWHTWHPVTSIYTVLMGHWTDEQPLHTYLLLLLVTVYISGFGKHAHNTFMACSHAGSSEQPHKKSIFDSASITLKTKNNGTSLFSVGDNWYSWSSIIQRGLI